MCPKNKNHGFRVAKTAVAIAVSTYNDGANAYAQMLEHLGLVYSAHTTKFIQDEDNERIRNAQRKGTLASLEYRRAKRRAAKESKKTKRGWGILHRSILRFKHHSE
ncbi:hypothetical protein RRG08_003316, partial [Elysia crispata]